jgi:DNA invertase Pin-like site-specific DNA recombinase
MSSRLRCAIYTRKSSEEGLEQNFNSLHAQREACEAYVLSQAGEGWTALKAAYDDGGYSGGSMERPGLQALLDDIRQRRIDVVVVYKVDRLTRSLADFAKIVELFDATGVSFVSVTQAFNTTTSMGRLTLNVLLSFAQFEREVTGERIRDKVAASKAKGLRMGGRPPLGYDIKDGRLVVNEPEAVRVRHIFARYLAVGSVRELEADLHHSGILGKRWTSLSGREIGGGVIRRGPLYYLLSNPVYRGVTRHKDKRYPDTHPAIIDEETWDKVQAQLQATNARQPAPTKLGEPALLQGLLFDDRGEPMVAVHTTKGARRYRYHVSRPKITGKGEAGSLYRVSAGLIEQALVEQLAARLAASWEADADATQRVVRAVLRVTLNVGELIVAMRPEALGPDLREHPTLRLPFHLTRRGAGMEVKGPNRAGGNRIDRPLVRALVLARRWARQLETGEVASVRDLARQERLCKRYTANLLPLAYLAPDLAAAILEGRQPRTLTLSALATGRLPLDWAAQRSFVASLG